MHDPVVAAARTGDERAFRTLVAPYQRELRAHCYRMSGSIHDADDLLQDSLLRAWRGLAGFEGRSSMRTWLYKVATSACLDALDRRPARARPIDLGPPGDPAVPPAMRAEPVWIEPCPDDLVEAAAPSPEARYGARESVALAFLAALQLLPPRQRAVLVLRDVLGWDARECAELLDTSVAAVNSALQRARETIEQRAGSLREAPDAPPSAAVSALLARYLSAWEAADVGALVSLLREDATLSMPPFSTWLLGHDAISRSLGGMVLVPAARGNLRLVATRANGEHAFAVYQRDPASGALRAGVIQVLTLRDGLVASIDAFLDPSLFARFGLPDGIPG